MNATRANRTHSASFSWLAAPALCVVFSYTPDAWAADCDTISNTIFGSLNIACGSNNTVGGTFGSALPGAAPSTINNTALGLDNRAATGNATAVGYDNYAASVNSTAVGQGNRALGRDSTAAGSANNVGITSINSNDGASSSAFGVNNTISTTSGVDTGGRSTAIGVSNQVYATRSTTLGDNNRVGSSANAGQGTYFDKSTAIGYQNWIYGSSSIAMGSNTEVGGSDTVGGTAINANKAVAIGSDARARQNGTVAIGDTALAGMSDLAGNGGISYASYNAIAIGANARVFGTTTTTGAGSVAIGSGSVSTGNSSVSLGENSLDGGQSNVVSVGNASTQRRITNVAPGTAPTDAVNLSQFNSFAKSMNYAVANIQDQVNTNKAGIAGVNAAINLPGLAAGQKYNIGVAYGNYLSYSALAVGGYVLVRDNLVLKISASSSSGVYSGGMGLSFGF